jgi:hypothetical protein
MIGVKYVRNHRLIEIDLSIYYNKVYREIFLLKIYILTDYEKLFIIIFYTNC